jgi:hypothetical protein
MLRHRLETLNRGSPRTAVTAVEGAPALDQAGKVRLFLERFRGRRDVYPIRFVRKRDGQPGYAPDCRNKFVRGVCPLPEVKCGACSHQAFKPVDAEAAMAHLRGRHVMGVYPLLDDDTCWFLAADFDGGAWQDDVAAFVAVARRAGLPLAIERSRSGEGAHVWFFFSAQVDAAAARRMGCSLLTEAMAQRHELSMASYDRLFPSQDTLPRGGFGNLIALPLQAGPRKEGNSIFLDERMNPVPDGLQWQHLALIGLISPQRVVDIAAEAARNDSVLGIRVAEVDEELPRTRGPSRKPRFQAVQGPLPESLEVVLSDKLYVPKVRLPSALLVQVKRLAAFQNPEFYKKQSMRLSTGNRSGVGLRPRSPRATSCA